MTIRARLTRIETAVEHLNPTIKKRFIDRDEFEEYVKRIARAYTIFRYRKDEHYTDQNVRKTAVMMIRGLYNFGRCLFSALIVAGHYCQDVSYPFFLIGDLQFS